MKNRIKLFVLLFLAGTSLKSIASEKDECISLLESEVKREFEYLSKQIPAVYYIDYRVENKKSWRCSAHMGNIGYVDSSEVAYVYPTVRVGDKTFDNTHLIKGVRNSSSFSRNSFPIEPGNDAVRQLLWNITDDNYKKAAEKYRSKKNNIKVKDEVSVDDFAKSKPVTYFEPDITITISEEEMQKYIAISEEASRYFLEDEDFKRGDVSFSFRVQRKYFVSSEGHSVVQNFTMASVSVSGSIRSDEGNEMRLYHSMDAFTPEGLPDKDSIMKSAKMVAEKLIALKSAPKAEPYSGPAILSGEASGVFFHEIFGHRIEGHRLKDENDGQTFKTKVGDQVLPESFSIIFDPQVKSYDGFDLNGYYRYDDQGVEGGKVSIVKDGVLSDFLMCRSPIEGFAKSNGHGRGDIFHAPVSRQSNMFIQTTKPYTDEELRKMLIEECKKQNVEYGYYFQKVTGGFTMTGRFIPNAFNVTPNEVYRVYVDGRPDELVRGVDLIGTPLSMFSTIMAGGNNNGLFNGTCGAESGGVPVASISPAILVGKVETQKKSQKFSTGPILPPPSIGSNGK